MSSEQEIYILELSKKYKLNIALITLVFETIKNIWKYFENIKKYSNRVTYMASSSFKNYYKKWLENVPCVSFPIIGQRIYWQQLFKY